MRLFDFFASMRQPVVGRSVSSCRLFVVCALGVVVGACSTARDASPNVSGARSWVSPYKIDVLQGNVVTREQVQILRPGLSKAQVRNVLGSPLVTSVFHGDRWDYVFTFKRQGQEAQQRRLTVFFKGDVLERHEADDLPSEAEFVSSLDARRGSEEVPSLEATDAQLKAFQSKNPVPAAVTSPAAPATNYPPLETPGAAR